MMTTGWCQGGWKRSNVSCHSLFKSQDFNLQNLYVADKINMPYIKQEHRKPLETD